MMNFSNCSFIRSYGLVSQLNKSDRKEIVFCGRSNVGKSTLINKLCNNNKLARVSSTPGKTSTINFFDLSGAYYLVDLPGYGFSKKSNADKKRWSELMEGYFSTFRNITFAVLLLDCRRDPNEDDDDMISYFNSFQVPYVAIITKVDKLNVKEYNERISFLSDYVLSRQCKKMIPYSSLKKESIENLRKELGDLLS